MPFKSHVTENRGANPRLFVCCTVCGSMGSSHFEKGPTGVRSFACLENGHMLTIDLEKVPDHFSPIAFDCSPDGSAFAHWLAKGEFGTTVAPTGKRPPKPEQPSTDDITDLRRQTDRLRALRDFEKTTRPEFADDPILLDAFDRIIARKKRAIMGTAQE